MDNSELAGRIVGGIVFLVGIGILIFVFVLAYGFFSEKAMQIGAPAAAAPPTSQLGQSALVMFVRIGLLIVMGIVGSLLAGRGIQLYFTSTNAARRPLPPEE